MALAIGNNAMKGAYLGTNQVRRAYKGGTLVYQGFGPAEEQEFIQQEATGGPAQLLKVYGKSVVNNQLVKEIDSTNFRNWNENGTATMADGVVSCRSLVTGSAAGETFGFGTRSANLQIISGHKYFIFFDYRGNIPVYLRFFSDGLYVYYDRISPNNWVTLSTIQTSASTGAIQAFILSNYSSGLTWDTNSWFDVRKFKGIDLTTRFGAGNEPTSVDEALRLLGGDAFDPTYDPGSLQSNKTTELRAERIPVINVWDEEWELGLLGSSGAIGTGSRICSSNYIPVQAGVTYAMRYGGQIGGRGRAAFYDENYNLVQYYADFPVSPQEVGGINVGEFVVPTGAKYLRFCTSSSYTTTYNNDICINLSDPAINGTYYPHWRGSLALNLSTLTGKLNGEGASVVVFPDGLRGVGTDRDAAYGSTGVVARAVVDLGTLNWSYNAVSSSYPYGYFSVPLADYTKTDDTFLLTAGYSFVRAGWTVDKTIRGGDNGSHIVYIIDSAYTDPAAFKAAMSGVMLDYPLATPLTYTLDTPLPTDLTCEQGDKLQRVSDNNCPFVGEMRFGL